MLLIRLRADKKLVIIILHIIILKYLVGIATVIVH